MKPLIIQGNETTPDVVFDAEKGRLEMSGVAIPEDVREMSQPILAWIDSYIKKPRPATELILFFEYLNTAASKMVYNICDKLSEIHGREEYNVRITWKYHRGDSEMLELGEDILEPIICLKNILAVEPRI